MTIFFRYCFIFLSVAFCYKSISSIQHLFFSFVCVRVRVRTIVKFICWLLMRVWSCTFEYVHILMRSECAVETNSSINKSSDSRHWIFVQDCMAMADLCSQEGWRISTVHRHRIKYSLLMTDTCSHNARITHTTFRQPFSDWSIQWSMWSQWTRLIWPHKLLLFHGLHISA